MCAVSLLAPPARSISKRVIIRQTRQDKRKTPGGFIKGNVMKPLNHSIHASIFSIHKSEI
jgi:hypothetical protein